MPGRGAPLICIIRRRLIPLQLIITSNPCTSFPHCWAQPSGFPARGRQRSSEMRWLGAGKHFGYHRGLYQLAATRFGLPLESCWPRTQDLGNWGRKGASALRLLIRNAFGAMRVLTRLLFKMPLLCEKGHKQIFDLIVSYFESFGFHWFVCLFVCLNSCTRLRSEF